MLVTVALQVPAVKSLMNERASMDQSYDNGPDGRFGGHAKARRLILDNPFGIGTHTFRTLHHHEEAHSVYLSMFLNAGWFGGYVYVISTLIALFVGFRGAMRRGALQGAPRSPASPSKAGSSTPTTGGTSSSCSAASGA
jgi:hypothetical protein